MANDTTVPEYTLFGDVIFTVDDYNTGMWIVDFFCLLPTLLNFIKAINAYKGSDLKMKSILWLGWIIFELIFEILVATTTMNELTHYLIGYGCWNFCYMSGIMMYQMLTIERFSIIVHPIKKYSKKIDYLLQALVLIINSVTIINDQFSHFCKYSKIEKLYLPELCLTPGIIDLYWDNFFSAIQFTSLPILETLLSLYLISIIMTLFGYKNKLNNAKISNSANGMKVKRAHIELVFFLIIYMLSGWTAALLSLNNFFFYHPGYSTDYDSNQVSMFFITLEFSLYFNFMEKLFIIAVGKKSETTTQGSNRASSHNDSVSEKHASDNDPREAFVDQTEIQPIYVELPDRNSTRQSVLGRQSSSFSGAAVVVSRDWRDE
ncbi:hypothetical protein HDU92_002897 [Lobulomyces angularis]|nr:hypothetical protein HDU92_002897 [Lobulomyces angularis]